MQVKLTFLNGPSAGHAVTLDGDRTVVAGRSTKSDLQIPDERASRRHFAVKVEGPLLKTGSLQQLRARQGVPSKRGRIMPVHGRFENIDADLAAYRINAGQVLLATTEMSTAPTNAATASVTATAMVTWCAMLVTPAFAAA